MCWNLEVSLITGLISYTIALYLYIRNTGNDRWHAAALFTISSIQFVEAIIWYMHNNNGDYSMIMKLAILLGIPLVLALEPISTLFGAQLSGIKIDSYDKIIYGIFFVGLLVLLIAYNSYPNVVRDGTIHYQEGGYTSSICYWIFFAFLVYPFIKYGQPKKFYIIMSAFVGFLLFMSLSKGSPGSTWCLYGNLIAIILLFYPYIISAFG